METQTQRITYAQTQCMCTQHTHVYACSVNTVCVRRLYKYRACARLRSVCAEPYGAHTADTYKYIQNTAQTDSDKRTRTVYYTC